MSFFLHSFPFSKQVLRLELVRLSSFLILYILYILVKRNLKVEHLMTVTKSRMTLFEDCYPLEAIKVAVAWM